MRKTSFIPASLQSPLLLLCLSLLLFPVLSPAFTWYVPDDFGTIQLAINGSATFGDEVIVKPGTYVENINFNGKNIDMHSVDPTSPTVVAATIIDGGLSGSVVTFAGTETAACKLSGFTIRNGSATSGGGLNGAGAFAVIQYNQITSNTASSVGGGINNCNGVIQINSIYNNSANDGGGLFQCGGTIQNNTVADNAAGSWGGGLAGCGGTIQNNLIYGNSADYGGGLMACDGTIQHNTIHANSAASAGGGLYDCYADVINCIITNNVNTGFYEVGDPNEVKYCNFYGNTAGDYYDADTAASYSGTLVNNVTEVHDCISEDPEFVDAAAGDFHLLPTSLCIDAGGDASPLSEDFEGTPRPLNGTLDARGDGSDYDIGADEYFPCPIYVPADRATIQAAIDDAVDGCEVIVSPGTYVENIDFDGKNIVVRSTDPTDPSIVASTMIDGDGAGSVVTFDGSETAEAVLSGFTLTNGWGFYEAGGIYGGGTLATIEYNIITSNTAQYFVFLFPTGYWVGNGAGIWNCDGTIQYNTIVANFARVDGGGLYGCDGTIQNNLIYGNSAGSGGGLENCDGTIQHNTIYGNSGAGSGGGLKNCNGTIQNNIVWLNSAPTDPQIGGGSTPSYCCIQSWSGGGTGNITDDPLLADPANGDFHLTSPSLCIDAGGAVSLSDDFEGDPRPYDGSSESRGDGSDYDIGADEYYLPVPPPDYCATFEGSTDSWSYGTVAPMVLHTDYWANASSQTDATAIGLNDPNDTTNYFAMWDGWQDVNTPLVDWADDTVFVAFFQVSTSGAGPAPSMRMRFFTNHNKFNSYVRIYPADWINVPTHGSSSLEVPVVNHPTAVGNGENGFALAFDIVDFGGDPRGGHIGTAWLDEVCVYAYDEATVEAGFSSVRAYTASQLGTQWSQMTSAAPGYQLPSFSSDGSGLHITTTAPNTRHFGAWTVDAAQQASFTNGDLHRIVYNVQASDVFAPQMRLRTHSQDYLFASYVEIVPGPGDGQAMPSAGAVDVPVYFWPPGTVAGTPQIVTAFDGIDIELAAFLAGTIDLHSVDVEKMSGVLAH